MVIIPDNNNDNYEKNQPKVPANDKNIKLKSAQTLSTIAIIGSPVSLLIGGILLDIVALVCGIVALVKVRSVIEPSDTQGTFAYFIKTRAIIGIVFAILAFALNLYSFISVLPMIMSMLQATDLSEVSDILGSSAASDGLSSGTSVFG